MRAWKKALSLTLAIVMTLALSVPAMAAGTTEEVVFEDTTVTITNVLRIETNYYLFEGAPVKYTIYVVGDEGATVTAVANPGYVYDDGGAYGENAKYAVDHSSGGGWDSESNSFTAGWGGGGFLTGPATWTVDPYQEGNLSLYAPGGVNVMVESAFASIIPFDIGTLKASGWAKEFMAEASSEYLFPYQLNPVEDDMTLPITRAEFAAVAVQLYWRMGGSDHLHPDFGGTTPFTDIENSSYRYDIENAYALGITGGTSETTFSPDAVLNREQGAVMLAAVYKALGGTVSAANPGTFADDSSISSWAKEAVYFMSENGTISGVGENNFAPQNQFTREQAMIIVLRMFQNLK